MNKHWVWFSAACGMIVGTALTCTGNAWVSLCGFVACLLGVALHCWVLRYWSNTSREVFTWRKAQASRLLSPLRPVRDYGWDYGWIARHFLKVDPMPKAPLLYPDNPCPPIYDQDRPEDPANVIPNA